MARSIVAACRRNMTPTSPQPPQLHCCCCVSQPAGLVLLLFFANKTETHQPSTFKINIENKFRINLEVWISSTVIQYKSRSPDPDSALEKTIIAAANHLSFGLGSQTSTIQIKWSSKFKFANHYSFSVPPSIRLTVDGNWARCLEHKQRKPVNCPN